MVEKEKRCENCDFYESNDSDKGTGQCHFNAPLPSPKHPMMNEMFYKEAYLNWPRVKQTDWCGQYKDKQKNN